MANLQAASSSEASRSPAFKTSSRNSPECFNGTQPFKVRSFIDSCPLIVHNDPENLSQDRKKVFMPLHFSLAGLQNGLSLTLPISPVKIQITVSIHGNYLNLNTSPYFGTQMNSENLKHNWIL
ncbi:hypothetical protein O181_122839 [Austropuccinia psidii MF-1]|uniref:Uncharacterized protein n=1 Tax=Austropuccinia psidii MF-1 TaxID=1389203 RepID=A0A9Q3KLD1_9BASI|nr:hypothetical protein [Austropuccinia psidii MF-1]